MFLSYTLETEKHLTERKINKEHSLQAERNPLRNIQKTYEGLGNIFGMFSSLSLLTAMKRCFNHKVG